MRINLVANIQDEKYITRYLIIYNYRSSTIFYLPLLGNSCLYKSSRLTVNCKL